MSSKKILSLLAATAAVAAISSCSGDDADEDSSAAGGTDDGSGGAETASGGTDSASGGSDDDDSSGGTDDGSGGAEEGSGGADNLGGMGGESSMAGSGNEGPPASGNCTITLDSELSEIIPTVINIEWESDLSDVDSAVIEYGPTTDYGMTAPIDLDDDYTSLLGLKPSSDAHFRVVLTAGDEVCSSANQSEETGEIPDSLAHISVVTAEPDLLNGGYVQSNYYLDSRRKEDDYIGGTYAYILDADGDYVWWYNDGMDQMSRMRQSPDGKHMWVGRANVPDVTGAHMYRIKMDGSEYEDLTEDFIGMHHDFTFLPDGRIAFMTYGENGCDDIKLWDEGTVTTIINAKAPSGDLEECHTNALEYWAADESLIVSDLNSNRYFKVGLDGEVKWVLGSDGDGDFPGVTWNLQHGIHLLAEDRFLIFVNGVDETDPSRALEIQLDLTEMTASAEWEYLSVEPLSNAVMGDVHRLPNGNTLVTYSFLGIMHEVAPDQTLVRTYKAEQTGAIGYASHRTSLYGAPPE